MTAIKTETPHLRFAVSSELRFLLRKKWRDKEEIHYPITRRASVKDIIEAIGIPHTEIGFLASNGRPIDFAHIPRTDERILIDAFSTPFEVDKPSLLRPYTIKRIRFLADINVGKLASLLRMTGIDTALYPEASDEKLAERAAREERILLTRDRQLLCRSIVHFGRLLRAQNPYDQLREVIEFFGLQNSTAPFTRCMKCNRLLDEADKVTILEQLEPRTKLYYQHFRRCPQCKAIFWPGSHRLSIIRHLQGAGLEWIAAAISKD